MLFSAYFLDDQTGQDTCIYKNLFLCLNRDECRDQVNGYSGARYKKFGSAAEAEAFVDGYDQPSYHGS